MGNRNTPFEVDLTAVLVAQPSGATLSVGMLTGVEYGVCGNTPGEHLGYGGIGWTATLVWARLRPAFRVLVFLGRAGWCLLSTPIRLELVGTDGTDGREIMNVKSSAVSADPVAVAVRSLHAMVDGDRADFDALYHPARRRPISGRPRNPIGFRRRRSTCSGWRGRSGVLGVPDVQPRRAPTRCEWLLPR